MDGKMGVCPDWYVDMQAAKYLNCKPWELPKVSIWWKDKALIAMEAEAEAQKIKNKHGK